jgi:N-acetylmuramoyl-L-alanine amidase
VPLQEQQSTQRAEGFLQDLTVPPRAVTEYVGSWTVRAPVGEGQARVEWVRGGQTTRTPLAISLAVIPEGSSRTGVAQSTAPSGTIIGQAMPGSGSPYHWFFPTGTRVAITGEQSGMLRVRLTRDLSVWVNAAEVRMLEGEAQVPIGGGVGAIRVVSATDHVELRLAMTERLPFRVDGAEQGLTVTVYGGRSRTNWVHHSTTEPLIRRIEWEQPRDDEYRVQVELTEPLWGWEPRWDDAGNLVIRVRRPPRIDPREPLRGLRIAVDAGHPPGGAIGPTRLTEAEANLAISKRLVALLQARGAEVLEIRPDTGAVALGERPVQATRWGAHLLVSVHNNAFPDGVNPFMHAGTSVFYNQPQSLDFARSVQNELLREFGLPDLGIARADLALVRPSAFPSILTETMFLMVPEQENALRDPGVHERIARAHLRGIEAFLRQRVAEQ